MSKISKILDKQSQTEMTPNDVLENMKQGNERYVEDNLSAFDLKNLRASSVSGQNPKAVVLSCIDSRVVVEQVLSSTPAKFSSKNIVVAYEPVWAIGTGEVPSKKEIQEVHSMIRQALEQKENETVAGKTRILYGGSVKPDNAAELMGLPDIDGALVGGASLSASDFLKIAQNSIK